MDNITARNELRYKLLDNGYRPLPLAGKHIKIKGWVSSDIDSRWVDRFTRNALYSNTGIRCDDLIAFDIDVTDADLADKAEALIEDAVGYTPLCRIGQWPKRLLLYRVKGAEPIKSARTGRFGDARHMVELLCSRGRQFAAFGVHPGTGEEYMWLDDCSPLDVPRDELPGVSEADALAALDALELMFVSAGLARVSQGGAVGQGGGCANDLRDDTEFLVAGDVVAWRDLKRQLDFDGCFGNFKRENGEWGDSEGIHFMLSAGAGEPCAHDFTRDCTHYDVLVPPALAEEMPSKEAVAGAADVFVAPELADLIENWVLLLDGTVRHVDSPGRQFELAKFHAFMGHKFVPAVGPKGKPIMKAATKMWVADEATQRAHYASLRPDHPDVLIPSGDMTVFNTYRPPSHASGGECETALEFVDHLIPCPRERDIFLNWHAVKTAHPARRMHALMQVTPVFGTGRGTWTQIQQRLWGAQYVREVPLAHLVGSGSQAQYNDWLESSLIISVPEALDENADSSKWAARHAAYEQLKTICDPVASDMYITRKYGKNSTECVYASICISSNHLDVLAVPEGDRRLIVLDNTEVPIYDAPHDLYNRIHAWKGSPANIGALHRYLLSRADSAAREYDCFGPPPMTPAKQRMIEVGQSDMDCAFEWMQENAAGDVVTHAQWRDYALRARNVLDLNMPLDNRFDRALTAVIQKRGRRIPSLAKKGKIKVNGVAVRPWVIRNFVEWSGGTPPSAISAEIGLNGVVSDKIHVFPAD